MPQRQLPAPAAVGEGGPLLPGWQAAAGLALGRAMVKSARWLWEGARGVGWWATIVSCGLGMTLLALLLVAELGASKCAGCCKSSPPDRALT